MILEKAKASNVYVFAGFLLEMIGRVLHAYPLVALPVSIAGVVVFIIGCYNYAEAKGIPRRSACSACAA